MEINGEKANNSHSFGGDICDHLEHLEVTESVKLKRTLKMQGL
jgi:hypothetical protein